MKQITKQEPVKFIPIFNEIGEVVNRDPQKIKPLKTRKYVNRSKK